MKIQLTITSVKPEADIDCGFESWGRPLGHIVAMDGQGRRWLLAPANGRGGDDLLDELSKAFASEVGMDRPGGPGQEE